MIYDNLDLWLQMIQNTTTTKEDIISTKTTSKKTGDPEHLFIHSIDICINMYFCN